MSETVVFSQLSRKFIDENDATPDAAQQVYYSGDWASPRGDRLLEAALSCPWSDYLAWIATLEEGSTARRKMEEYRSTVRSLSTPTILRCWRTRLTRR